MSAGHASQKTDDVTAKCLMQPSSTLLTTWYHEIQKDRASQSCLNSEQFATKENLTNENHSRQDRDLPHAPPTRTV
eukprot:CAMPEP_0172467064 /NCGR_PEP_ID=MMETSP1065-20121228/57862_1 /TAXON_ID=265537 /ORGANISM="Amphiprora paludosa, Strain CCMP125" /LENGTH=75 /DNA_ID=CAMNT_0013224101 /DNA_START=70 /DNA_END=294 /DNA_ORIENTATION=+